MIRPAVSHTKKTALPAKRNVLGGKLAACSNGSPTTGFYRDGCCNTGDDDHGSHTICAVMTEAFLAFTRSKGNDLSTPRPEWGFPGLEPGDRWCLCAMRWVEAMQASMAPPVVLEATHENALEVVSLADLQKYRFDHSHGSEDH